MTIGQQRVRLDFNRGESLEVDDLKVLAAELIDAIVEIENPFGDGEIARLKALAATSIEEGAMWAVKAATG